MARLSNDPAWLVADFGATNLRFAQARRAGAGFALDHETRYAAADFGSPAEAVRRYLDETRDLPRPTAAALAVAGPVLGDRAEFTNVGWHWSIAALRRETDLPHLVCLNDAEAHALSLPYLTESDLLPIGPAGAAPVVGAPRVLIAPGSGLGVSALIVANDRAHAIAGEGGHATMAPETEFEQAVYRELARTQGHVSWERVLSGPGIGTLFRESERAHGREPRDADAARVSALAEAGDLCARQAIETFGALLGACAGNLALIFGAHGGVFIGGGIAPAMAAAIEAGPFRQRFESKGRFDAYLRAIPTAIVTHPNPGLIGAAAFLVERLEQGDGA